jgi:hypothetical protein
VESLPRRAFVRRNPAIAQTSSVRVRVRDVKSRTKCVSAMSFLLTRFGTTRIA